MTTENLREKILADMYELAEMYLNEDNINEALCWLNSAAELGSEREICIFGDMYRYGRGVKKNIARAVKWYELCEELEFNEGTFALGEIYRDGEGGIQPDGEKAIHYFMDLVEEGNDYWSDRARFALGCIYLYGQAVERDIYKAAWWFAKTDEIYHYDNGEVFDLAECYRTGDGIERDINVAIAWYEKIIEEDFACLDKALFALAEIYFHGDDVKRDIDTAIDFYQRAADEGNVKAAYRLAEIYFHGDGVEKDLRMVKYLLDKTIKGLPIKIET